MLCRNIPSYQVLLNSDQTQNARLRSQDLVQEGIRGAVSAPKSDHSYLIDRKALRCTYKEVHL